MTLLSGAEAFASLQRLLVGERTAAALAAPAYARLAKVLREQGSKRTANASTPDLLALVRHALRFAATTYEGEALSVPDTLLRIDNPAQLTEFGLDGRKEQDGWRLRARPWTPAWLDPVPPTGVDGGAVAEIQRRQFVPMPADPFVGLLGHQTYQSVGQRAAIRAVADAPEGSTLAVVLPTGEGKSLCFYVLASSGGSAARGVTVVVTPTISLAMDHQRAASEYQLPGGATAYEAENDESRRLVLDGLSAGTLSLLFASPEALVGSLRGALRSAAQRGLLRALVIDEAHLVDAWGGTFRPHFQLLAGLKRELAREALPRSFRTVLLTATLTDVAAAVLRALFIDDPHEPLPIVASAALRPEIDYWTPGVVDQERQMTFMSEAVRNLPRPLILYATEPPIAARFYSVLTAYGFSRILLMTGETDARTRRKVVSAWREMETDIVVATSAFGLGIDNQHVRSVIHACLPETLDRYYQEVGRSGRDGRASVSLLIPTHRDVRVAKGLGSQKPITAGRGRERWEAMFFAGDHVGDQVVEVRVDDSPGKGPRDIDMVNDENTLWNLRTLTLMAVSGLIDIEGAVERGQSTDPNAGPAGDADRVRVRIRRPDHRDEAVWEEVVGPHRIRIQNAARASFDDSTAYLGGSRCLGDALASQYRVDAETLGSGPGVQIAATCPGCHGCRGKRTMPQVLVTRVPVHPWPPRAVTDGWIVSLLAHANRFVLTYTPPLLPEQPLARELAMERLARLISGRFRNLRLDPSVLANPEEDLRELQALLPKWEFFVGRDPLVAGGLPLGPAVIVAGARAPQTVLRHRSSEEAAVVLLPVKTGLLDRYDGLHLEFEGFGRDFLD